MDAGTLHTEIAKVCPIVGCSVGKEDDRTTWKFSPAEAATDEEKYAGQNVIDTIEVDYKPPPTIQAESATLYDHENRIRAIEGQPALTVAQFLMEAKAKTTPPHVEAKPANRMSQTTRADLKAKPKVK